MTRIKRKPRSMVCTAGLELIAKTALCFAVLSGALHAQQAKEGGVVKDQDGLSVEVLHWWTAGSEAQALGVLRQNLKKQGIEWQDMPIVGGAGVKVRDVLNARVQSEIPPTAAQSGGYDILYWTGVEGALGNLNEVARLEGWDLVVPQALQRFSKADGTWVAAPVNIHSTNWLWINKSVLDKAGLEVPQSWEQFIDVLGKLKQAGIVPLAHGGQPWQDATLFESVVLSLGANFYRSAFIELAPSALQSRKMLEAFERMAALRNFVDDYSAGRDWNVASAFVIAGKAGMQVMGDWAKGEFLGAGQVPGEDFVCVRFPDTQGSVIFNSDQFVMFNADEEARVAQHAMASAAMSAEFQVAFNTVKGSVPARTDIPMDAFDPCARKSREDIVAAGNSNSLLGSMAHHHAVEPAVKEAIFKVVSAHFNGEYDSRQAVDALARAVAQTRG